MVLLLSSCGGEPPPVGGEARDEGGEAVDPLALELVTTIDGEVAAWGRIGSVLAGPGGSILLGDQLGLRIHVLDAGGSTLSAIGEEGDGPGDLAALAGLAWQGDRLLALDPRLRRVTAFDAQGTVLDTWAWPDEAGFPRRLFTSGGSPYGVGHVRRAGGGDEPGGIMRSRQPDVRYVRFGPDGPEGLLAAADTSAEPRGFDCMRDDGAIEIFARPIFGFGGPMRAFTAAGELVRADHDRWRIEVLDATSGEILHEVARDTPPRSLLDSQWDRLTRSYRDRGQDVGGLTCDIDQLRPAAWPVLRSVTIDDGGRFWVEAFGEEGRTVLTSVEAGTGRLLGEAVLPARDGRVPLHVRNGRIYLVSVDSLGVQSLQVYEIE